MDTLQDIALATWEVFLLSSPFVLVGLAGAGLLHVLLPQELVARWLGQSGPRSILAAACLGVPLPLCSCSVVPVTIELSRKGASREASLAFMVSTPETGVDSILLTYGLMGPLMALVRPLAALLTSLVAGFLSFFRGDGKPLEREIEEQSDGCECMTTKESERLLSWPAKGRLAVTYGFGKMVDEIGFWLVAGLLLTGIITALVPDGVLGGRVGSGPLAHLTLLLAGIPLYMCASASTPVAAALIAKGVSPGAALVFLLAGPATNASSLVVIGRFFGRHFIKIYLSSVVLVALLSGFTLDLLVSHFGWQVISSLSLAEGETITLLFLVSAFILAVLLAISAWRGSWRGAMADLARDLGQWRSMLSANGRSGRSR